MKKKSRVLSEFEIKVRGLINSQCLENESNTPDWILAKYLQNCMDAYNNATKLRDNWYGGKQSILDSEKSKNWKVSI